MPGLRQKNVLVHRQGPSRRGGIRRLFLLGLIAVLASCGPAAKSQTRAASGTGAASGACPYPIDNGCAAANPNGSFQNASLLISAQQSGQTSLLPKHPMTFNIPGVDYPIGPDKTLRPRDPRTINDGICRYSVGSKPEVVLCFGKGREIETLDNYDFSGAKIGKGPVLLYAGDVPAAGSLLTITNSYFYIPAIDSKAIGFQGNWSIKFWNNQCDGSIATLSSQFCFGDDGDQPGTRLDVEYSVFSNQQVARVVGGGRYIATTYKYNFIQGLNDQLSRNHGEVDLRTCSQGGCNSSLSDQEGNFVIWNRTRTGSVNNATFFPSSGSPDRLRFAAINIINNVIVTNTSADGGAQVGKALFNLAASNNGIVTITGNWVDATGAYFCGLNGVANGGDSITASTSRNTITVSGTSSSFNNNPIEPGWMIYHSGFAVATITAFGTGRGNLGTYIFDGAPQAIGSDSAWTIAPGITRSTLTGNYNLADPSHTGVPTPIGFNGPLLQATNCLGAHN